jgi:precorrin-6Y C5,15-methyltransferase (decarboxylating) CbiT subunit
MNDFFGIPDEQFVRGNIPMTKFEVRMLSISKLRLRKNDKVLDIGAGTGSISVEIARVMLNATVFAVEQNPEAIRLIEANKDKFDLKNLNILLGRAPELLRDIGRMDKVFVGGSDGEMENIIKWSGNNLAATGRIVINAITLDTLYRSKESLVKYGFEKIEIIQVGINKFETAGKAYLLKAQNPSFIMSASAKGN